MSTLILDIETVGEDFDEIDTSTQEILTRWIDREADDEKEKEELLQYVKDGMGFSPLTGEVVAIGILDREKDKKVIYFQAPGEDYGEFEKNGVTYKQMNEAQMLYNFWKGVEQYSTLVTFNGKGFDIPFLMIRSAIHKIRPSKNFMSNRYLGSQKYDSKHVDLQDELTFYGAVRRKGALHLWCRAFGIRSPKVEGVSGDDVARLFRNKEYKAIAEYNIRDVEATRDLYEYWREYLQF